LDSWKGEGCAARLFFDGEVGMELKEGRGEGIILWFQFRNGLRDAEDAFSFFLFFFFVLAFLLVCCLR